MERALRPRGPVQYVGPHEDDPMVARKYDVRSKFQEHSKDRGFVNHMREEDFTLQYIQENGFQRPLVFKDAAALGLKVPPASLTVSDVKTLVGARRQVDVMDLHTQETHAMTMHHWAKYYESRPRQKILNVISLEFSRTKLDPLVQPPTLVRQLDWVELVWPQELKNAQTNPTNDMHKMMYPKVQKYCLMSVAGCYTDFHLDFGGTSVWYHVLRGEKQFLLIPPSPENYAAFQSWQLGGQEEVVFLGDMVPQCQLVRLRAGDTFIMPAGWIHAVYTPVDSLVFGGNFLHSFNIDQQMRVAEIEKTTKVPTRLQYPFYGAIHWYTLLRYNQELQRMGVEGSTMNCGVGKSSSDNMCSQRWLRSVSVQRLILQSFSNRRWLKCVLVERLPLNTSTGKENKVGSQSDRLHGCPAKPHLSCYEQKGLLTLVHAMRHDNLFGHDIPHCISHPMHLLDTLEAQLRSPSLVSACSPIPTGIALILPPPTYEKIRAEKRKRRSTGYHPRKRAKLHKNSSCAVKSEANPEPHAVPNPSFEDQALADQNEVSSEVACEEVRAEDLGNPIPNMVEGMCTDTTILSIDQDIVETPHAPTDLCSLEVQGDVVTAESLHPSERCSNTGEDAQDCQHLQNAFTVPPSSPAPPPPSSSPALQPPSSPAPQPPSSPAPQPSSSPAPQPPSSSPPQPSSLAPPQPSSLAPPQPSSPVPLPSSPLPQCSSPKPLLSFLTPLPPTSPAPQPPSSPAPLPPSSPAPLPPSSPAPLPSSSPAPLPPSSPAPLPPSSPAPLPSTSPAPLPPSSPVPLPPSYFTPPPSSSPSSSPAPPPPSSPILSAVSPVSHPTNSQPIQFGPPIQMDLLSLLALANATKTLYHQTHQLAPKPRPTLCLTQGITGETVLDSRAIRPRPISSERTRRQTNNRRKCLRPRQYFRLASHPSTSDSQSRADALLIESSTACAPPPLLLADTSGELPSRHAEWAAGSPVEPLCSQLTADVLLSPEDPMLSRSHDLPLSGVTTPTKGLREEGDSSAKAESPVCFTDDLKTEFESFDYEGVTDVAFSSEVQLSCSSAVSLSPLKCPPCARTLPADPPLHSLCVSHEVGTSTLTNRF